MRYTYPFYREEHNDNRQIGGLLLPFLGGVLIGGLVSPSFKNQAPYYPYPQYPYPTNQYYQNYPTYYSNYNPYQYPYYWLLYNSTTSEAKLPITRVILFDVLIIPVTPRLFKSSSFKWLNVTSLVSTAHTATL